MEFFSSESFEIERVISSDCVWALVCVVSESWCGKYTNDSLVSQAKFIVSSITREYLRNEPCVVSDLWRERQREVS